jgi:hypothetical protein
VGGRYWGLAETEKLHGGGVVVEKLRDVLGIFVRSVRSQSWVGIFKGVELGMIGKDSVHFV